MTVLSFNWDPLLADVKQILFKLSPVVHISGDSILMRLLTAPLFQSGYFLSLFSIGYHVWLSGHLESRNLSEVYFIHSLNSNWLGLRDKRLYSTTSGSSELSWYPLKATAPYSKGVFLNLGSFSAILGKDGFVNWDLYWEMTRRFHRGETVIWKVLAQNSPSASTCQALVWVRSRHWTHGS